MRALVYVQHLLGTGHVIRAAAIARALAARSVATTLVSGNRLPPTLDLGDLDLVELPPARARDAAFSAIVDDRGRPIDEAWRRRRATRLLQAFDAVSPDIVVTETWPFGRNAFAFEMEPLRQAVQALVPRPVVATSVRDILVRKEDPAREQRMAARAREFCDLVLVHSDPALTRFEDSFPLAEEIADLIRYTGYVGTADEAPEPPPGDGEDEVIVSCGGGAVGAALLGTAIAARPLTRSAADARWRILVGADMDDLVLIRLQHDAGPGIIVERARADFPRLLPRARLSISQCGYNTALDVVAAGCPAVFVPFARPGETEQTQRAEALAARGLAVAVAELDLTPQRLAAAIDAAAALPCQRIGLARDGAQVSAGLLIDAVTRLREQLA